MDGLLRQYCGVPAELETLESSYAERRARAIRIYKATDWIINDTLPPTTIKGVSAWHQLKQDNIALKKEYNL